MQRPPTVQGASSSLRLFRHAMLGLALLASGNIGAITLAVAQRELLANNTDIALAQTTLEGASANVIVAGQPQNPTLSLQTTQYSPIGGLGAGRPIDKQLDTIVGISIPIERGDKLALRREQARAQLSGARHDLRDIRRQQRLALAQAYYDLKLAEEKLGIAAIAREIGAQALGAADKRVAAGDLALVDRIRLSVEALRSANELTSAETDLRQARVTLAIVIGRKPEVDGARGARLKTADLTADDSWPPVDPDAARQADSVAAAALAAGAAAGFSQLRADVAAADARVTAANAGRAVARSLRIRDVTVGAQVERVPVSSSGLTFGVSVSIPLFVRYGYEGEIARAEADYSAALLTRQKAVNQAQADAAKAAAALDGAGRRLASFEGDIQPAAKKALEAIEFAYTRGAAGLTDTLDARRTWHATLLDLSLARADYAKALAAWRAATQWETGETDAGAPLLQGQVE